MWKNISDFMKIAGEKGLVKAFIKSVDYLAFSVKKTLINKKWSGVILKSDGYEIRGWNTGPRLYTADGKEITKGVGLNASIYLNGRWHDSSKGQWEAVKVDSENISLKNTWKNLPLSFIWDLKPGNNGRFKCSVKVIASGALEPVEQKFGIMLSDLYDTWRDDSNKKTPYPSFSEWTDVKGVKKDSLFLASESHTGDLPELTVSKTRDAGKVYAQVQNSSFKIKSRLLNFVKSTRDMPIRYNKGENNFFEAEISLK